MGVLSGLQPQAVFRFFEELCAIPHGSHNTKAISDHLAAFAKARGLKYRQDELNNVVIWKGPTPGYENAPAVMLQGHMDMVAEKDADCPKDMETEGLDLFVEGDLVGARGTTLGGDDGIAVAMALAILDADDIPHGPLECLFTVDEETGLTGAMKLQDGMLRAKRLINLDSEDDGQIFIGCAGGIDTLAKMHYVPQRFADLNAEDHRPFAVRISVSGLMGGHSGDDINKGRANANKIIVEFLNRIWKYMDVALCSISGGNLRNAIAREAEAVFVIDERNKEVIRIMWNEHVARMEAMFGEVEKDMRLELESCDMPETYLPFSQMSRLLMALNECPHGVISMSADMPGLVETSTNLASIKMKSYSEAVLQQSGLTGEADPTAKRSYFVEINTSQRSSKEPAKHFIKYVVEASLSIACDEVTHGDGYPGWAPNPKSELLEVVRKAYTDLYHDEPKVLAIHAGLECGLFLEKYPYLDMVSIGPQMYGVHSPQERLSIPSTEKCYKWLCEVLKAL